MFSEVFKWFSSNLHMPVPKIQRLKIEEQFSVLLQNEKGLLDKYQNPVGKLGGHNDNLIKKLLLKNRGFILFSEIFKMAIPTKAH